jgi:hypothetical protein
MYLRNTARYDRASCIVHIMCMRAGGRVTQVGSTLAACVTGGNFVLCFQRPAGGLKTAHRCRIRPAKDQARKLSPFPNIL